MSIKRELEKFLLHKPPALLNGYYNKAATKVPDHYNKDNIICQWISTRHTKRYRRDLGDRN